jgi:predicted nucleic acid-binding protein
MDQPSTVLIDACVLYSAPVRDLVVRLAQAELLRARWTTDIHEEWMRNVLGNNPMINKYRLERTRSLMDQAVPECLVTGYGELVNGLTLPDPDDRHVLAAAIQSEAEVIVTYNLTDFPSEALAQYNIEAIHPDRFSSCLFDTASDRFCEAVQLQRQSLKNPPKSVDEFLSILEAVGLPQTAARLRNHADRI